MPVRDFLFNSDLGSLTRGDIVLFSIFGLGLALSLVFLGLRRAYRQRTVLKKLFSRLLMGFSSFGIIGLVWSGLRYLAIPYLGLRFVAALIIATFLLWFLFVLKYLLFQYSTEQSEWAQAQLKKRYLKIK